ncbi:hypothetical protein GW17_00035576 [Ensete ventricosum]|nr:hypothetical protein GW17_00035576 [Ensete ventricosum]
MHRWRRYTPSAWAAAPTASATAFKRQLSRGSPLWPCSGRLPLAAWPEPSVPAGGRPLQRAWPQPTAPLRLHRRQQALTAWPLAAAPCGLAIVVRARGAAANADGCPLQEAWLQSAAPLQVVGRPYKGAGRGHARLSLARASFAAKT